LLLLLLLMLPLLLMQHTPHYSAQALVGNLLAALIPRQQLVPAVVPEKLHPDPAVVCSAQRTARLLPLAAAVIMAARSQCTALTRALNPLLWQVDAFKQDPLVFHGNLRAMTGNQLLKVAPRLPACLLIMLLLSLPLLLLLHQRASRLADAYAAPCATSASLATALPMHAGD
jgi:hypothetical protein